MHKDSLISLLKTLSQKDTKNLLAFLKSPYFNNSDTLFKLYIYLKKSYPHFEDKRLQKNWVFKHLFPNETYNEKKLKRKVAELKKLIEQYLVIDTLQQEELLQERLLAQSLISRSYGMLEIYYAKIQKKRAKMPIQFMDYYQEQFRINYMLYFHPESLKYKADIESVQKMTQNLDNAYFITKLRCFAECYARKWALGENSKFILLKEIKILVQRQLASENPLATIYLNIINLYETEDNNYALFKQVKDLFLQNLTLIPQKEQPSILSLLINFAYHHYNRGTKNYLAEALSLYNKGLNHQMLLYKNTINNATFLNIVIAAAILKQVKMAKGFMNKYGSKLRPPSQQDIFYISSAFLAFHQGHFIEAYNLLNNSNLRKFRYALLEDSLSIRCEYELLSKSDPFEQEDKLLKKINNFKRLISRTPNLSSKNKQAYTSFGTIIYQLTIYKGEQTNTSSLQALKNKILKQPIVTARFWLLDKVEELL